MSNYFVGRGIVYASQRDDNGDPEKFIDLGNCSSFILNPGSRGVRNITNPGVMSRMIPQGDTGGVSLTIDETTHANLAQCFYGDEKAISSGSGVNTNVKVKKGGYVPVDHINISNLSISGGAVEGTDYTYDGPSGMIYFLPNAPNITEDATLQATYNHTAYNVMAGFSKAPEILHVRLNGVNAAKDNEPVIVDVYKVRFAPVGNLELIGEKFIDLNLVGKILYDSDKAGDVEWGNYFRIRTL